MSRKTTRPLKRQKERQHPSIWFFIALAVGVVLLIWLFSKSIHQPPRKLGEIYFGRRTSIGTRWTTTSLPFRGDRMTMPRRASRFPEIETRSPSIV